MLIARDEQGGPISLIETVEGNVVREMEMTANEALAISDCLSVVAFVDCKSPEELLGYPMFGED